MSDHTRLTPEEQSALRGACAQAPGYGWEGCDPETARALRMRGLIRIHNQGHWLLISATSKGRIAFAKCLVGDVVSNMDHALEDLSQARGKEAAALRTAIKEVRKVMLTLALPNVIRWRE